MSGARSRIACLHSGILCHPCMMAHDLPPPSASVQDTILARVRIVLSHTTKPGNIGASARALKTMGLQRLILVQPSHFPHREATFMAAGAADMLEHVEVCDDLDSALAGVTLAVA